MKRITFLFLSLCGISLSSQNRIPDMDKGVYIYEEIGKPFQERTCLILGKSGGKWFGRINATTDEFETAREGYEPGYIVAPLEQIKVVNDSTLSFSVTIRRQFQYGIPLYVRNETEAVRQGIPLWTQTGWQAEPSSTRQYQVVLSDKQIVVLPNEVNDFSRRVFMLVE